MVTYLSGHGDPATPVSRLLVRKRATWPPLSIELTLLGAQSSRSSNPNTGLHHRSIVLSVRRGSCLQLPASGLFEPALALLSQTKIHLLLLHTALLHMRCITQWIIHRI